MRLSEGLILGCTSTAWAENIQTHGSADFRLLVGPCGFGYSIFGLEWLGKHVHNSARLGNQRTVWSLCTDTSAA